MTLPSQTGKPVYVSHCPRQPKPCFNSVCLSGSAALLLYRTASYPTLYRNTLRFRSSFLALNQAMMIKVLVHGCQEARRKPLIHGIQTSNRYLIFTQELALFRNEKGFPFRKPLGIFFETFFKALDPTFVQVPARFHEKLVILSGPAALHLRFLCRVGTLTASATSRAHSSPVSGVTFSWIAIFTSCNQTAFLFPVPLSSHSFLQNQLGSSMFSNIRGSSRARFPGFLYLGR